MHSGIRVRTPVLSIKNIDRVLRFYEKGLELHVNRRYIVGYDAKSILKVRKSTSDKEFENWMYESILQEKGFVRTSIVEDRSI